jgi:thiol:disulfide interchange protein DsbD
VAVIVGSALWLLRFPQDEAAKEGNIPAGWQAFSPELLQQLRDEGKPVFVDFGAEWCLTCKTNENAVLLTSDVMAEFREQGVDC